MDLSNILVLIVGVICLFAIFDLIVGVGNDAINFLSPSVGSKVAKYKTIIIIASLGLLAGAVFSSGMMEVARKGIFHPQYFSFLEIIILFLSVIVADILLLNRFNSLGMPTSTTVSIVFCLLGGAVGMGVIKLNQGGLPLNELATYINTAKVLTIILGILGSVIASFVLGSTVQYIVRLFFTFDYEEKPKYWAAILGGIAITVITHFILVKGLKSSALPNYKDIVGWVQGNLILFLSCSFVIWSIVLQVLLLFKVNVYKLIVLVGTFSLAMAFAGNDLVNFIGVPLAALKSYVLFTDSGIMDPNLFLMEGLSKKEKANTLLLILGGCIMVATIIFSKKAKRVLSTGLNLSRQNEGKENFSSSLTSKVLVRNFLGISKFIKKVLPKRTTDFIESRFVHIKNKNSDITFDYIRASVVLICASILISIATAYKLPLSTTYVTFMVAMGAAFADKAWGRESAVYRVNGVLTVIVGWFLTAFGAFLFAFLITNISYYGGTIAIVVIITITVLIMTKPLFSKEKTLDTQEVSHIPQYTGEYFHKYIQENLELGKKYYKEMIEHLETEDVSNMKKLHKKIYELKENVYGFKKKLIANIGETNESDMKKISNYVGICNSLKTYSKTMTYISDLINEYIDNNHIFSSHEIKKLKKLVEKVNKSYQILFEHLEKGTYAEDLYGITKELDYINSLIEEDIQNVQSASVEPQSSVLYIGILNETKYLLLEISAIYKRLRDL